MGKPGSQAGLDQKEKKIYELYASSGKQNAMAPIGHQAPQN